MSNEILSKYAGGYKELIIFKTRLPRASYKHRLRGGTNKLNMHTAQLI